MQCSAYRSTMEPTAAVTLGRARQPEIPVTRMASFRRPERNQSRGLSIISIPPWSRTPGNR